MTDSAPGPSGLKRSYNNGFGDEEAPKDRSASHQNGFGEQAAPAPGLMPGHGPGTQFEIFDWWPAHQSCQKYFLDHAQYEESVLAVCALVNITLPHQWHPNPVKTSKPPDAPTPTPQHRFGAQFPTYQRQEPQAKPIPPNWVSLVPFIRRLIVTGFDRDAVLHGFFGDDWRKGVGPIQECERRNYLFAAKSGGWGQVKAQYDMNPQETVPFLQPPQNVDLAEIENAEKLWSQWLAVEDWMVGPRAPESMHDYSRSEARSSQTSHPP